MLVSVVSPGITVLILVSAAVLGSALLLVLRSRLTVAWIVRWIPPVLVAAACVAVATHAVLLANYLASYGHHGAAIALEVGRGVFEGAFLLAVAALVSVVGGRLDHGPALRAQPDAAPSAAAEAPRATP